MKYIDEYRDGDAARKITRAIHRITTGNVSSVKRRATWKSCG